MSHSQYRRSVERGEGHAKRSRSNTPKMRSRVVDLGRRPSRHRPIAHCLEELAAVVALALSKLTRDSGQRVLVQIGNSGISKANGMRRWEK